MLSLHQEFKGQHTVLEFVICVMFLPEEMVVFYVFLLHFGYYHSVYD
jgi:hypothetical protein